MELTSYTYVSPENVALGKISIFLMVDAASLKDFILEVKTQESANLFLIFLVGL